MKTGNRLGPPAVLLCVGPEKWIKDRAVAKLKLECLAPGFEELDLVVFQEPPAQGRDILEAVATSAFGSPKRLVIVEGLESIDHKTLPWLEGYLKSPNPKACLVLCAQRLEREIESKLLRGKQASIHMLRCQGLKGGSLKDWILGQAQSLGKKIEPEAAVLLMTRVGSNLQSLEMSIESLTLFAGDFPRIARAHVEALMAPSMRETAFDILDTAASGRPEIAVEQLRQALAQGHLTVEQLMGALGWYYRMVWKAQQRELFETWSPARRAALERLTRWPEGKLQKVFDKVLEADASLKLSHPAPELLADQLLFVLAGRQE